MKSNSILFLVIILLGTNFSSYSTDHPKNKKIQLINYTYLEEIKQKSTYGEEKSRIAFETLIARADEILNIDFYSVVNKLGVPPSGNKHDYMTIAPYWWPNPETANKLPYVRRDGEINPEARNKTTDFVETDQFFKSIHTLYHAYYLSKKKVYAEKAINLINYWFLNKETKMNPNLNYGQSIPGLNDGRKFGIIEFGKITEVIKCLEICEDNNLLPKKTKEGMKHWLSAYSEWLQNSELGQGERDTKNNHGTHYDAQLLSILIYLEKIENVKTYLTTVSQKRIFDQISADGSQPLELARTKSFNYSVMNLHGFLELTKLGNKVGVDLWNATSKSGASLKKGYQYMFPFLLTEKEWTYKQIKNPEKAFQKIVGDLEFISSNLEQKDFETVYAFIKNRNNTVKFKTIKW